jgi:hypothetical protein
MAYDAGIILQGQPVNVLGAMSAGNQLAAQTQELQRQNALSALYKSQGAGIMNGDPGALNALAQYDPNAALGIKQTQQNMADSTERLQIYREVAKNAAADRAKALTAEQRAAEAAKLESGLKGAAFFYQKGDRQGYTNFIQQQGLDPNEFTFDSFPAHAAQIDGVLEAYKTFAPPDPSKGAPSGYLWKDPTDPRKGASPIPGISNGPEWRDATPDEAKAHGAVSGQINTKTGQAQWDKPQPGMRIESDGQGGFTFAEGAAAGGQGKPFTEGQTKDIAFATRAEGALQVLEPVAGALTSRGDILLEKGPLGVGRDYQNREFQLAKQAGDEFLQAILRKDTGAAITAQEQELYGTTYLPQPGDSPQLLTQKAESRKRAVAALKAGMGATQIMAQELALSRQGTNVSPAQHNVPQPGEIVDGYRFKGGDPSAQSSWEPAN